MHLRFLLICLIGFTGFLRVSELLNLKISDITFSKSGVTLFVEKSKTDQLREGNLVYISKLESRCCPVFWLNKYLSVTGLKDQSSAYLICRLFKTKKGHNAHGKYPISYSTIRETFKDHLARIIDPKKFCLHSLRSGGASAAANHGITDRQISKHGRWSSTSNSSRDRYIKDSASNRFKVTQSLGL